MKLTAENVRGTLGVLVKGAKETTNFEDVRQYRAGVRAIRLLIDGEKGADRFAAMIAAALRAIEARLEHLYQESEAPAGLVVIDSAQFEEIAGGADE